MQCLHVHVNTHTLQARRYGTHTHAPTRTGLCAAKGVEESKRKRTTRALASRIRIRSRSKLAPFAVHHRCISHSRAFPARAPTHPCARTRPREKRGRARAKDGRSEEGTTCHPRGWGGAPELALRIPSASLLPALHIFLFPFLLTLFFSASLSVLHSLSAFLSLFLSLPSPSPRPQRTEARRRVRCRARHCLGVRPPADMCTCINCTHTHARTHACTQAHADTRAFTRRLQCAHAPPPTHTQTLKRKTNAQPPTRHPATPTEAAPR